MGNWNISIRGVGSHHNEKNAKDADRMARRFVRELREAGHIVMEADITYGGAEALTPPDHSRGVPYFNPEKPDDTGHVGTEPRPVKLASEFDGPQKG